MQTNHFLSSILLLSFLSGCAHSYYYSPEIAGKGAMLSNRGSIEYTIPTKGKPELLLHVRSLGVKKKKNLPMLGVRLSFTRPPGYVTAPNIHEFLDPKEQVLRLGVGGKDILPAFVHSKAKKDGVIDLSGSTREVVELLYPLANDSDGASQIGRFYLQWKVHFAENESEQQVARFDRHDAAPQQSEVVFPEDNDYPYDVSPMDMPGWEIDREPYWWGVDPNWPMMP